MKGQPRAPAGDGRESGGETLRRRILDPEEKFLPRAMDPPMRMVPGLEPEAFSVRAGDAFGERAVHERVDIRENSHPDPALDS